MVGTVVGHIVVVIGTVVVVVIRLGDDGDTLKSERGEAVGGGHYKPDATLFVMCRARSFPRQKKELSARSISEIPWHSAARLIFQPISAAHLTISLHTIQSIINLDFSATFVI